MHEYLKGVGIAVVALLNQVTFAETSAVDSPLMPVYEQKINGVQYAFFRAKPSQVSFHWKDEQGQAYQQLSNLKKALDTRHQSALMLMNAGIFSEDLTPAGLWIERGKTLKTLNTKSGTGNFHMQPNGVFSIEKVEGGYEAFVRTTQDYQKSHVKPEFAVQSGPMLVIDGAINPRFKANNMHSYKRNAVCTTAMGELLFAMTVSYEERWPNLYELATALQQQGCNNALYLDGSISSWYVKDYANTFHWSEFVGMIAVTTP
ncbi:MAG: phosphodiester glycosidase family protein [Cardiobacteriaceae bacterium]|nr:phosphodiester glycosidase family protein [Cardiobacteriaceae bacterium]